MAERGTSSPAAPIQFPGASLLLPSCFAIIFLSLLSPTGLGCPEQPLPAHPSSWLQGSESISQRNLPALGLQGDGLSCQRREGFPKGSVRAPGPAGLIGYELWMSHPTRSQCSRAREGVPASFLS